MLEPPVWHADPRQCNPEAGEAGTAPFEDVLGLLELSAATYESKYGVAAGLTCYARSNASQR